MDDVDLVVVGAGPAGLSTAWAALRRGWRPLVLDRAPQPGGAWTRMWPDMRCLSERWQDVAPDGTAPQGPGRYASAAEVAAHWQAFAARHHLPLRLGVTVQQVRTDAGGFEVQTTAGPIRAPRLVLATGEHGVPYQPDLPGSFDGPVRHSAELRPAELQAGQRVVVVGDGNSAAMIAERAVGQGARVVLCVRRLLGPQGRALAPRPAWLTRMLHHLANMPADRLPGRLLCQPRVAVQGPWLAQAVAQGQVQVVPAAAGLDPAGVRLNDGRVVPADLVVLATGFERELRFADRLLDLGQRAWPRHHRGLVPQHPGLAVVGLPCARTLRSGFLRGMVQDAAAVVEALP